MYLEDAPEFIPALVAQKQRRHGSGVVRGHLSLRVSTVESCGSLRGRMSTPRSASAAVARLDRVKARFGNGAASAKLSLLRAVERADLRSAATVWKLHDSLCFLRAYPDDAEVLHRVERLLSVFHERRDVARCSEELANSGIAGAPIDFAFYWVTASWLARHHPERLTIDWEEFEGSPRLDHLLHLLVPYAETPALDQWMFSAREWISRLKGSDETDATFLVRRFEALTVTPEVRESLYEAIDLPMRLTPGARPSRTNAHYPAGPVHFQTEPPEKTRPRLQHAIRRPPVRTRVLPPADGRRVVDLAREAMVTRSRDLDTIAHADERDVRLVDCGEGIEFALIGMVPERRVLLETVYVFLTLRNGVPIGYVQAASLFRSSEINYNVFAPWRGYEAAAIYARALAMVHATLDSDAFTVEPYQLGEDNEEALQSGAFWFYYKLGFRPEEPSVRRVLRSELARMKKNPRHRSNLSTLRKLAEADVFFYLGKRRDDVMGKVSVGNVGLRITEYLADSFGSDREEATRVCASEAQRMLGVSSLRGFKATERLAWERWAPLVMILPGVERWPVKDKRALVQTIRAKGGRHESEFARRLDGHARLRKALMQLASNN